MPIYRSADSGMVAAILHDGDRVVSGDRMRITAWPSHSWDEVTAVELTATALD